MIDGIILFDDSSPPDIEPDSLQQASSTVRSSSQTLDLSDTGLERFPDTLVLAWPSLEELILSNNRLEFEDETLEAFKRLTKLRKLAVAGAGLSTIPKVLNALENLKVLDLSDNLLTSLPSSFAILSSLTELYLDKNDLSDVPGFGYTFKKLRVFSCSYNRISNGLFKVPPVTTMMLTTTGGVTTKNGVDAISSINDTIIIDQNESVNHEELTVLNLRSNFLKGIIRLSNYENLAELDLSENSIEQLHLNALQRLQYLRCSKNQLTQLSVSGNSIKSIIAGNNKLKTVIVTPLPKALQHLDVSYNELDLLPEWIASCHSLKTLFATHNRLTELPSNMFSNENSSLLTLQLNFNQLTALPQTMRRIPLQELFLQNNSLTNLPRHFFHASCSLKVLNVSKNCLKELPQYFSKNETLERLYLTCNALTDIMPLLNCVNLRILHVAYNAIGFLPDKCVTTWREMEELVLSGNNLSYIPENCSNWLHLRILRLHSNLLSMIPNLANNKSLKILDISHNQLEKVSLSTLIPKHLQYLDISGNARLHVDSKQYSQYKQQRVMNLIDVSGRNRGNLPYSPLFHEHLEDGDELVSPWTLGFTETTGHKERLYASQLRLHKFCDTEALVGIFDTGNNAKLPKLLQKSIPRILLEERTVKKTVNDYMKYTILSAYKELKDYHERGEVNVTLCHVCRQKSFSSKNNAVTQQYVLRIANVGDTKSVLSRNSGSLTISHSSSKNFQSRLNSGTARSSNFIPPDPHVTEIILHDQDQFLLLANKSLWDVISTEEAVAEVRSVSNPILAAKRLQDLAQCYGCDDNLSIIVVKFQDLNIEEDALMKELRITTNTSSTTSRSQIKKDKYHCRDNGTRSNVSAIDDSQRSSPSGQSDKCNCTLHSTHCNRVGTTINNANEFNVHCGGLQRWDRNNSYSYYSNEGKQFETDMCCNGDRQIEHFANNGHLADGEESSSDKSAGLQMPEERFRCWEYMLEQNTQMLFDKELNTLTRNFGRHIAPSRPELWPSRAKSVSHLPDFVNGNNVAVPFLSKQFGSTRSYNVPIRLGTGRRSLNGGPNAAYFGSLQRLMPYYLTYDFSEIKEHHHDIDSLEADGRMQKYWDVTTTEL